MNKLKILLADDHEMLREGISDSLKKADDLEIVAQAGNGQEVIDILRSSPRPHLLVLDINMPQKDGIEVTAYVKEHYPKIKILILSMHYRSEFISTLLQAGADGYVLKTADRGELLKAIRQIASGEKYFSNEIAKKVLEVRVVPTSTGKDLSEREKQVLALVARGKSSIEIADELNVSKHTIDSHRKKISLKLNTTTMADLIMYALKTGIIKGFDIK